MQWFTDELTVLQRMIVYAASEGFESYAWRLAWACTVYLRRAGRRSDRAAVHRVALAATERAQNHGAHATTLRLLGDALARLGQYDESTTLLQASHAEFRALDDDDGIRQAHLSLARVHESRGRYEQALEHASQALRLADEGNDPLARADGLTSVARQKCLLGHHADALRAGEQALSLYSMLGHLEGQANALMNLGLAEQRSGRHAAATVHYERSLDLDRRLGDRFWEAHALDHLADVHLAAGDRRQSLAHREAALAIFEASHHPEAKRVRTKLRNESIPHPRSDQAH